MTKTANKIDNQDQIFNIITKDFEGENGFFGDIQNSRQDKFKLVLQVHEYDRDNQEYRVSKSEYSDFNEKWKLCILDQENQVAVESPLGYPCIGSGFTNDAEPTYYKLIVVYANSIDEANILKNRFQEDLKTMSYEEIILEIANYVLDEINKESVKDRTIQDMIDQLTSQIVDEQTDDLTIPECMQVEQEPNPQYGYQQRDSRLTAIQRQLQANTVEIKKQEAILNEAKLQLQHLRSMQQVLKGALHNQ